MKCENCLHYEACGLYTYDVLLDRTVYYKERDLEDVENRCFNFADKDLYIKLPCKLNLPEELYRYMFDDDRQAVVVKCKVVKITGYGFILKHPIDGREWEYTYDRIGKTVFLTREDAEKKLEELKIEECAELIQAINKKHRGRAHNISEEIADVEIYLEQLKIINNCADEVENYKTAKMERLKARITK